MGGCQLRILIIGSGGREHALAWRLAQGSTTEQLFASPGNPGITRVARCVPPRNNTPQGFLEIAEQVDADLTIVGPEAPLTAGIVDCFRARGRQIVGPTAAAAKLEGSKIYAKELMKKLGVPTAHFFSVNNEQEGLLAIETLGFPVVLKADGLAAGKGVIIARDRTEAVSALRNLLSGKLVGEAGSRVVVEEYLTGEEVSFIVLTDGCNVLPLEPCQDHKAVYDNDTGPNTGGMGAYCDSHILNASDMWRILDTIVLPVVEALRRQGEPFTGFLYTGLIMTSEGPKVLEFNVRLGDPETQALMHRLKGDLAPLMLASARRNGLKGASLQWDPGPSVCVVLAAAGYPGAVRTGDKIEGIEAAEALGATVFHAGTKISPLGVLETAGGRVLGVTASGKTLAAAIDQAYAAAAKIHFEGMHYRKDIGRKGLKRW
jgi:phosphoribosylamine--glycine ligase